MINQYVTPRGVAAFSLAVTMAICIFGSASAEPDIRKRSQAAEPMSVAPKSTVASWSYGRWDIALTCSGGTCKGSFPKVAKNRQFVIQHVSCYARVNGGIVIEAFGDIENYLLDLNLGYSRTNGGKNYFTFNKDTTLFVSEGKIAKANMTYTGTMEDAYCLVTGELDVLK
jgi:hypothetical protein